MGLLSAYLTDLISKHVPSQFLRSRDADLFYVRHMFSSYGDRRFGVHKLLRNSLPKHIQNPNSVFQFKRLLKIHFFLSFFS